MALLHSRPLHPGAVQVVARSQPDLPVISKRVEKLYTIPGCRQPNDLQFAPEGLWVLDQVDQPGNRVFLVRPETGAVLRGIMTDSIHGSGISVGNGALWIASTKMKDPTQPPVTLKVEFADGEDAEIVAHPGLGVLRTHEAGNRYALGRTRSEVGGRQILGRRSRRRASLFDRTRNR